MKTLISVLVIGVVCVGCAGPTTSRRAEPVDSGAAPQATVAVPAQVTLVNAELRFVVIDFGERPVPRVGTAVELVRGDKPVAKVRLTEPARGRFITADILEGSPNVGDRIQ